jgi:hypothetical protein
MHVFTLQRHTAPRGEDPGPQDVAAHERHAPRDDSVESSGQPTGAQRHAAVERGGGRCIDGNHKEWQAGETDAEEQR